MFFQITPMSPGRVTLLGRLLLCGASVGFTVLGQIVGKMPTRRAGETPATRGGAGLLGFSLSLE
ncbi:MAG: hypothetical protein ACYSUD_19230, partial [Planctomycetota bacterium]